MNLKDDLRAMMRDLGVSITDGTRYGMCFLDSADELLLSEGSPVHTTGKTIVVTVPSDTFENLKAGQQITVDMKPYVIREKYEMEDGLMTRLLCAKK